MPKVTIQIPFDLDTLAKVDAVVSAHKISRSEWVRMACRSELEPSISHLSRLSEIPEHQIHMLNDDGLQRAADNLTLVLGRVQGVLQRRGAVIKREVTLEDHLRLFADAGIEVKS